MISPPPYSEKKQTNKKQEENNNNCGAVAKQKLNLLVTSLVERTSTKLIRAGREAVQKRIVT